VKIKERDGRVFAVVIAVACPRDGEYTEKWYSPNPSAGGTLYVLYVCAY
jgi:hypothetical protein